MNHCKGIYDWIECSRCEQICTAQCPIESPDAMRLLEQRLKAIAPPRPESGQRVTEKHNRNS